MSTWNRMRSATGSARTGRGKGVGRRGVKVVAGKKRGREAEDGSRAVDGLDAQDVAVAEGALLRLAEVGVGVHREAGDAGPLRVVEAEGVANLVRADVLDIHRAGGAGGGPLVEGVVLPIRLHGHVREAVVPGGGHGDGAAGAKAHELDLVDAVELPGG